MTAFKDCLSFLSRTIFYLRQSREFGASIPALQKAWTAETIKRFKISIDLIGAVSDQKPLLLVGNHISYLDIPLIMSAATDVSFVAKKELAAWPVIGRAARAMNTIFVERGSTTSRQAAREAIREGLRQQRRIVVFPSGTTCVNESKAWRMGVFEIAKEMAVPVQPFRLNYSPLREVAFIDEDLFPVHLYKLAGLSRISAHLEFHPPVTVTDPMGDCLKWQTWAQSSATSTKAVSETASRLIMRTS